MIIVQKISNKKTELSDKIDHYLKDDGNMIYLCGLMTGSTAIAGLTDIVVGKYLDGCGILLTSYLLNRYAKYVKEDMRESKSLSENRKCHCADSISKCLKD